MHFSTLVPLLSLSSLASSTPLQHPTTKLPRGLPIFAPPKAKCFIQHVFKGDPSYMDPGRERIYITGRFESLWANRDSTLERRLRAAISAHEDCEFKNLKIERREPKDADDWSGRITGIFDGSLRYEIQECLNDVMAQEMEGVEWKPPCTEFDVGDVELRYHLRPGEEGYEPPRRPVGFQTTSGRVRPLPAAGAPRPHS